MQTLTISKPDDFHLHLRDGEAMSSVVNYSAAQFSRAIVMPNLKPPITTVDMAVSYYNRILDNVNEEYNFEPLMTLYLTDNMSPSEIDKAAETKSITALKYYPAGATTNSDSGVTDIKKIYSVLEAMMKNGLPLLLHGEVNDIEVNVFDREKIFIDRILTPLVDDFSELKIVLEHISTKEAVDFILNASDNLAATITPQHVLLNRSDFFDVSFQPHNYCLPVLKEEHDRLAVLGAATSGNSKFFLGTDSAPHPRSKKESGCGCAGIFSAYNALGIYAEIFDEQNKLDKLEAFASFFGADFYGLERNDEKITLIKNKTKIPEMVAFGNDKLVPLRASENCAWQVKY